MKHQTKKLDESILMVASMAIEAYCQGTFSVGGILLDKAGNLIHKMHNNVIKNNILFDPTAHGERQLIDWYFKQKHQGIPLPEPEDIILITSLDPCCMCTASIIASGFHVVVAAYDNMAGINYNGKSDFPSLTYLQKEIALKKFSYPKVNGNSCFKRPEGGASLPKLFKNESIKETSLALCASIYTANLAPIRHEISYDLDASYLKDPKTLSENHPIRNALKKVYPHSLEYSCTRSTPDVCLAPYLLEQMQQDKKQNGPGSAVALLDYFGNLLLCLPGAQNISTIRTAFLETTRTYAGIRYQLSQELGYEAFEYLGHPKHGTFIFALGPDTSTHSLLDLGAYGSTVEGPLPSDNLQQFQYVIPQISSEELLKYCSSLPPLYSETIKINPVQVKNQELIAVLQKHQ
ncbi:cytosine deaminase [Brevinema andersonii]|uniref:Cytosine deaminase n=1 Tax=Brevinema andersonii TaxID=34097 RepID=A0A1I1ESV3_BREAD|nr:nucleoside deaminase [Brevinema andersonii]SFB89782.1 cytosine deaminase [Brevinema andersonii]